MRSRLNIERKGLSQATLNNHYHCCRQMILSSGNPKDHDMKWFDDLRQKLSAQSFSQRKMVYLNVNRDGYF